VDQDRASASASGAVKKPFRSTDSEIRERLLAGAAVKPTARSFGVTEWRVRRIARSLLTQKTAQKKDAQVRLHTVKSTAPDVGRVMVWSDIHIPYHDHGALAVAMAYAADYKPTVIVLNGDVLDFHEVSSHPQDKHNVITFEDELSEGRQFLRAVRAAHPKAEIVFTMGNHEDRLQRYLTQRAPELSSLTELALDRVLDFEALGIRFINADDKYPIGPLEVFHGSIIRKDSGNSARAHMERRGGGVLMGHTHRLAMVSKTDRNGTHWAVENGHLSDPSPSWTVDPNWQQGFTTIDYVGDLLSVRLHHVAGGRLLVGDRLYTAKA